MKKDFDGWNEVKKATHKNDVVRKSFPKEREILSTKRLRRQVDVLTEKDFEKVIEMLTRLIKAEPLNKEGFLGGRSH